MFEQLFATLDNHLRSAAVAQIGGFRPDMEAVHSWFGGSFAMLPGESWPHHEGKPMIPVLQIRVDELPVVPRQLGAVALLALFVTQSRLPIDLPSANGEGWVVRTYASLQDLEPVKAPPAAQALRPFQVRWALNENEGPDWLEILQLIADPDIGLNDSFFEACKHRYRKYPFTKVGGWPATTQEAMHTIGDPFVFQVASEEKPRWMVGDNGNMYFFADDESQWSMYWDCY